MNEIHDAAAAYALDALDDLERARFERHLSECPECVETVQSLAEVTSLLAEEVAEKAPSGLKERVVAGIEVVDQERVATAGRDQRDSKRWTSLAVAAALFVVVAAGWWVSEADQRRIGSLLADPGAEIVLGQPTPAGVGITSEARFVIAPEDGTVVLVAEGLRDIADGEVYQLWIVDESGAHGAGLFRPSPDGTAVVLLTDVVDPGAVLALTIEPEGGSDQPTGEVLLAADV